jgi:hypothetical protein
MLVGRYANSFVRSNDYRQQAEICSTMLDVAAPKIGRLSLDVNAEQRLSANQDWADRNWADRNWADRNWDVLAIEYPDRRAPSARSLQGTGPNAPHRSDRRDQEHQGLDRDPGGAMSRTPTVRHPHRASRTFLRWAVAALLLGAAVVFLHLSGSAAASPLSASAELERSGASFALRVGGEVIPYDLMAISAMPGEQVVIDPVLGRRQSGYQATASGGTLIPKEHGWRWRAPSQPGLYRLEVTDSASSKRLRLQAFVLEPYHGEAVVDGYRIGTYEHVPLRDNPAYNMPQGLIRVTPDMVDEPVSPHFRLGQFLAKQPSDYPKFVLVRTRLLLKLEMLLAEFNRAGIEAETFHLMSAYRTPFYNASIGNTTRYSRHCYGDAADIFIDRNNDGRPDDITGDGRVTREDAEKMARVVEGLTQRTWYGPFVGGLGIYGPKPNHGPFIHVDSRGYKARW